MLPQRRSPATVIIPDRAGRLSPLAAGHPLPQFPRICRLRACHERIPASGEEQIAQVGRQEAPRRIELLAD
ncbi:MAG: hypothetical protein ACTHMJ_11680, partial [Thermomicrobiales bacterium]